MIKIGPRRYLPVMQTYKAIRTNDVNGVRGLRAGDTNQEVVRLDVTVDEGLVVDTLDARDLKGTIH